MLEIKLIDKNNKREVNQFIQFHYDLYKGDPMWVPPFRADIAAMMNQKKHPFYEHSEADFFLALQDGKIVGRVAALMNNSYNRFHNDKTANFFLFDAINDQQVANGLLNAVVIWAKARGLTKLIGPKGFSLFDGYGQLVEGFDSRQMMNMSAYNYPYYNDLYEKFGLKKENDFVSMGFTLSEFVIPEKVERLARLVEKRGGLRIFAFNNRKEILKNASRIAKLYFSSFENNWEYFPMSDREIQYLVDNVIKFVDPNLVKFIVNAEDELIGFLLVFPDLSAAMQRHNGSLTPFLLIDLLREAKKTVSISLNGFGFLEEYRAKGGNAMLYDSIYKLFHENPQFAVGEATQMAESAREVQREMVSLGLKPTKRHRVYRKEI